MPYSKGSSSASIQAKSCKSSPKEIGGFSVPSGCSCVSIRGLVSSGISLTAASIFSAGVCWALTSVSFESSSLSELGRVDVMFVVSGSPMVIRLISSADGFSSGISGTASCSFSMSLLFCKLA